MKLSHQVAFLFGFFWLIFFLFFCSGRRCGRGWECAGSEGWGGRGSWGWGWGGCDIALFFFQGCLDLDLTFLLLFPLALVSIFLQLLYPLYFILPLPFLPFLLLLFYPLLLNLKPNFHILLNKPPHLPLLTTYPYPLPISHSPHVLPHHLSAS